MALQDTDSETLAERIRADDSAASEQLLLRKSSKPPRPKRRCLQFSLKALLLAMAILSLLLGMLGRRLQQARAEQQAALEIQKLGGKVHFHWRLDEAIGWNFGETHGSSSWVLPGDGYVHAVYFQLADAERVTNEALVHLKPLVHLRILVLSQTKITDAGLKHLAGLTQLEHLSLRRTAITGSGLEHLKGFKNLQRLDLDYTKFDDAGLRHVGGWTNLSTLTLRGTQVGDRGIGQLIGLVSLELLDLGETNVTDAGLRHLRELHGLRQLWLDNTSVTSAGIKQLRHDLPEVKIVRRLSGQQCKSQATRGGTYNRLRLSVSQSDKRP